MYIYSIDEFKKGDRVTLSIRATYNSDIPKYLDGQEMIVTGCTKKYVKCQFGEDKSFNIAPEYLDKLD